MRRNKNGRIGKGDDGEWMNGMRWKRRTLRWKRRTREQGSRSKRQWNRNRNRKMKRCGSHSLINKICTFISRIESTTRNAFDETF
jgi:hypothetical protein